MLTAAVRFGTEHIHRRVCEHIERLVTITKTTSVFAFPIGIPKCTITGIIELSHTSIVVPREMGRAAAIKS
jgi:hypothetical protein